MWRFVFLNMAEEAAAAAAAAGGGEQRSERSSKVKDIPGRKKIAENFITAKKIIKRAC